MMKTVAVLALASIAAALPSVLVTGATGRTGSILYKLLVASAEVGETRALITNVTTARTYLGCDKCDESEGFYLGDVTKPDTLKAAVSGVDTLAIAIGAGGSATSEEQKAVDFTGAVNQVSMFAEANKANGLADLRVLLLSSMGTTSSTPAPYMGGSDLFWKLNAEAFVASSGVPSVVLKPCGLGLEHAGQSALQVGSFDSILSAHDVARADVAAVMYEAVVQRSQSLRFDLCGAKGAATAPADVLKAAARPWQL